MLKRKSTEDTDESAQSPGKLEVPRSPYWLIVREDARGWEVFTVGILGDTVLPMFSGEEEARVFLRSLAEAGWRPRKTGAGELVSVLSGSGFSAGPCPGVEKIVLDPLAEVAAGSGAELPAMSRKCFLEHLMGRRRAWFEESEGKPRS